MIFCHTLDGNKDVYIGKNEMLAVLDGGYCGHEKSSIQKFVRTYHILNIKEKNDTEIEVTLENNKKEQTTVKIANSVNLMVGQTYEFSFYTFEEFEDTIFNIFTKAIYVSSRKTEKRAMNKLMNLSWLMIN